MNISCAKDNRGKNVYIARNESDSHYYFVPWDFGATWGLEWNGQELSEIFIIMSNNLYDRLIELNPWYFKQSLQNRWEELSAGILNFDDVIHDFETVHSEHINNGSYEREALRWIDLPHNHSEGDLQHLIDYTEYRYSIFEEYLNSF